MKESDRLTDGQIVSYKYHWLICYKAAGNTLLFHFNDYMEIYNHYWTTAEILANDGFLSRAIGIHGEFAATLESILSDFVNKSDLIATNQIIKEFES